MKILGNTLFVLSPNAYLAIDGETVLVQKPDGTVRVPLHNLEGIVSFGYTGASPALMGGCAQRGVAVTFLTAHGRFLARVVGEEHGNVLLRKTQYRISDSPSESAAMARAFLTGKLFNSRWVVERAIRDYPQRLDVDKLDHVSGILADAVRALRTAQTLEDIRGIEGAAATHYFSVLNDMVLQQKDAFFFHARSRRPPIDNVNALLSFLYTLLAHDAAAALETVGFDAYVGFLHRDRPGRISLALDLMEEFRAIMADRFALTLINTRRISPSGFIQKENGAVFMNDETRKLILTAWQKRKQETITHPLLREKIPWGLVPYAQAMLLGRFLRGDLDTYPPFLWK